MTKLFEWLAAFGILFGAWISLLTNKVESNFIKENPTVVLWSPIVLLLLFGVYAATVVLYRTFTFNDCDEDAVELQQEIKEARAELAKVGFKFPQKIR